MRKLAFVLTILFAMFGLINCGGGGESSVSTSAIQGSAIKGPIDGAEVKIFFFGADGNEVELKPVNTPVYTGPDGEYHLQMYTSDMTAVFSPLIIRTIGGTMGGDQAPSLEALIADPVPLTYESVTISCNLSTASSVAAGLLKKLAGSFGAAPTLRDAQEILSRVEEQLAVDLSKNPADKGEAVVMINDGVDQNLDLFNTPSNNSAVNEYIDYLIANLSSPSHALDNFMEDPCSPEINAQASFEPFGTGLLATIIPEGPSGYINMLFSSDSEYIENNGSEKATLTATLTDAKGYPIPHETDISIIFASGPGTLEIIQPPQKSGQLQMTISSAEVGETVIEANYDLPNGNSLTRTVSVTTVDSITDTDGDGFSDGEESKGWTVVVDELGYGYAANGNLLTVREVNSDPNMEDTDGDGLNDFFEYQIRTDPSSVDTDGDGLSDKEEWYQWITNPNSVDSDGDARGPEHNQEPNTALFDGNELAMLKTSPTLKDTDGDGRTDFEEADHPTRSPLVADLPRLELTVSDDVDVRLDVQYAEEEGQSRQYGAELSKSATSSTSVYHSHSIGSSLTIGTEAKAGFFTGGVSYKTEFTLNTEHTVAFTNESSQTSQESYSKYTTDSRTRTETAASGSITMGVQLKNTGNITYTITQLGLTVRQWLPGSNLDNSRVPGAFKTIATLTPVLGGGLTLAPGSTSPVLQLLAKNINASRIKELIAKPDSLYVEPAYYEMENAEGLNFAYLEEVTGPQTALVMIDFGNGRTEEYRVATNVERNPDSSYAGIPLGEIMDDVLQIPYETRARQYVDQGALTNEQVLYSVRDMETWRNEKRGFWTVLLASEHSQPKGISFGNIQLYGGDQVLLLFAKDEDGDGLFAAEEQHFRTNDLDAVDTDGDGLSDEEEVREGWDVILPDKTYRVYSDPAEADQDGDEVSDFDEKIFGTDPSIPDTDRDGLLDGNDLHPLYPARVLRVKEGIRAVEDGASWSTAFGNLQAALSEAKDGNSTSDIPDDDVSEIWVAAGRYIPSENGDRTVSFELSKNLSVYGGFTGVEIKLGQRSPNPLSFPTTLSGDLTANDGEDYEGDPDSFSDNSYHVVYADNSVDENTLLDGFYIIGGNAVTVSDTEVGKGGGMVSLGNPHLQNLFFRTNRANTGAGLYVDLSQDSGAEMTVTDCFFNRNVTFFNKQVLGGYGGGMYFVGNTGSILNINRCVFSENVTWGAAGLMLGSNITANIRECIFDRNDAANWDIPYLRGIGGGLSIGDESKIWIDRCRFTKNKATYGGGMSSGVDTQIQINQTIFWMNEGLMPAAENYGGGAGMYTRGGSVWIVNSTIACNQAVDPDNTWTGSEFYKPGGIWFNGDGSLSIENSIIYGNTYSSTNNKSRPNIGEQQIRLRGSPALRVRTSDIQGLGFFSGVTGQGNIDANPDFTDSNIGNLHLNGGSPCIDNGSNFADYDSTEPGFQLLPETDLDGYLRVVDGDNNGTAVVDMGPYENQGN